MTWQEYPLAHRSIMQCCSDVECQCRVYLLKHTSGALSDPGERTSGLMPGTTMCLLLQIIVSRGSMAQWTQPADEVGIGWKRKTNRLEILEILETG